MTPEDIQTISNLLCNRVIPRSALEGAAIVNLAGKLVSHFAPKPPTGDPAAVNEKSNTPPTGA